MRAALIRMATVASLLALTVSSPASQGRTSESELKSVPPITLADLDGNPIDVSEFAGKIIVLDFWATWCAPCIEEIPAYNKLQETYRDRGLEIVGVTLASGEASEVKPFVSRHGMRYRIVMGDDNETYDLNVVAFPTTLLVTRDWKVYRRYVGAGPRKTTQLESDIRRLIESGS